MISLTFAVVAVFLANPADSNSCGERCPPEDTVVCGFDVVAKAYTMFPGKCAMGRFIACTKIDFVVTPLYFCIKSETMKNLRRYYTEESCPVFCPQYYRPVCATAMKRSYEYRSFSNGCQLDMINCRGMDEWGETFCQKVTYYIHRQCKCQVTFGNHCKSCFSSHFYREYLDEIF